MISRICKALRPIKTKRDKTQINKMRDESEDITIDPTHIKRTVRECWGQLYAHRCDYLDEMDTFLERPKLRKLIKIEIKNFNSPI